MPMLTDPCVRPGAFSPTECARLIDRFNHAPDITPGRLSDGPGSDIRICSALWIDDDAQSSWIFQRLAAIVAEANREVFRFDLDAFGESVQILRYETAVDGAATGRYGTHTDIGATGGSKNRKLSLSVQLSAGDAYTGGEMEIDAGDEFWGAPTDAGTAILFPSFVRHRVTAMTSGTRFALVAWMHGPAFR